MQKSLKDLPVFDPAAFHEKTADWKKIAASAKPGGQRVVVEWSVGRGPNVFVYPAAKRDAGFSLTDTIAHRQSDERWADFLEFEFVPQVVKALQEDKQTAQVICADLRPLQIMRTRRRAIESASHEKTGSAPH